MKKKLPVGAVETTLSMVGSKWKFLIIRELLEGTKRFGEIKTGLATVTQKVLAQNLRELEETGLVKRKVYAQVPPKVEYSLTKTGETLRPVINAMANWGNFYTAKHLGIEISEPELEVEVLDETPVEKPREEKREKREMESFLL
ncbi:MAG: helix-turn-helix transcriptional regulator [Clostridia bacterium]|nr:helix-turn-helix transcriptional regulator [Clostridia bacterium]